VLGSGVAIAVFGLVIGAGAYVVVTQAAVTSVTAALESQVSEVSDQLSEQASANPAAVDLDALQATTPTFVQVVTADGVVRAATPGLADSDRICPQVLPASSTTDRGPLTLAGTQGGFLRIVTPVATPEGTVTVCAVTSDESIQRAEEAVLLALLIALPLLVLSVCVVVWLAVGRALKAVDDMASQAQAMQSTADGELRVRETHDEVEHLGHTLNGLLARLHHQSRTTRQFVADAGHELRNPLSTLRVTLEFGEDADEAGLRSSVGSALGDLDRLDELVQDLLVLARTDAMEVPTDTEQLDLAEVLAEGVYTAQRSRPDLHFSIETQACTVRGNGLALRSLVANLLDNAARHARTSVSTRVTVRGDEAEVAIDDDGHGLAPEDCERVFERFVRLDESRDRDEGGSGLGLSIVAAIAASHGGSVRATPGPGGHFIVTLPT
jgi:signal transduction histidine kinase